jgi:hypothetical protein
MTGWNPHRATTSPVLLALSGHLARVRGRILTRQAVGRKMAGLASFTTDELIVLAQWLNVPVAQFLPDTLDVAS